MSESGRNKLLGLAAQVKTKVTTTGDALLQKRGLDAVDAIAKDLTGPAAMPGLKVYRDSPEKIRLQRTPRNAEIALEWKRDILALELTTEKWGRPREMTRYVYDAHKDHFRRMEGTGEIYEDLSAALIDCLFPEGAP